MGKASFWSTYSCDRCGKLDHNPAGPHLPKGWSSDQYTGQTLCPACVERATEERRRDLRDDQVSPSLDGSRGAEYPHQAHLDDHRPTPVRPDGAS
jgi:hypothetical protein